ncbi:MAG: glycine/sarcosine/betaine reductase complex component C subunit beta [Bacillota bacterium]
MTFATLRGAAYVLVHTPDLVAYGSVPSFERARATDFGQNFARSLRTYDEALTYPPHQAFIGNLNPGELAALPRPHHRQAVPGGRFGPRGEIMPQDEFFLWLKAVDVFSLVELEETFLAGCRERFAAHPLVSDTELARLGDGSPLSSIEERVKQGAAPLFHRGRLVGCVRPAHEHDHTLAAGVMLENLVAKASGVIVLKHLVKLTATPASSLDYLIETSEEASGDENQRGGGGFGKAIGEAAGCTRATAVDLRSFCAGPAHGLVNGAALVKAGVFGRVAIVAGGALAKLGLNARSHVQKGMPILEDVLGGFAVLVAGDDGVSPILRTDTVGRHRIGSGSSPEAVMRALVTEPLASRGLTPVDVQAYSVEMQDPDLTETAGAGDIPRANYRVIAALAVKDGHIDRSALNDFVTSRGYPGFAPTQGHIPSGVPLLGHFRDQMLDGKLQRAMVIGKGSLFLGRITSLFDGVSVILEANPGRPAAGALPASHAVTRLALVAHDHEAGATEVERGARLARQRHGLDVHILRPEDVPASITGSDPETRLQRWLEQLLSSGEVQGAVASHYNFPLGVATVGRIVPPGTGETCLLAATTGGSAADRVAALARNAVYGHILALALGNPRPVVGFLNLDGARPALRLVQKLAAAGYPIQLATSARADGGQLLRGNDLVAPPCDVLVADTLTGNLLVKILATFSSGGARETHGWGYGPGIGPGWPHLVNIISRASAAPVIAAALEFAAELARAGFVATMAGEFRKLEDLGWDALLATAQSPPALTASEPPRAPDGELTAELAGIDALELEAATAALHAAGIPTRSAMGCTGPTILVRPSDLERGQDILRAAGYA